jgi:hypothetical protein
MFYTHIVLNRPLEVGLTFSDNNRIPGDWADAESPRQLLLALCLLIILAFCQGKVAPIPDPKTLSLLYRTKKYSVTLYNIEVISRKLLVQRGRSTVSESAIDRDYHIEGASTGFRVEKVRQLQVIRLA